MASGISATFVAGTGAAPASMILFGSLFLVLALMKRVPLNLEVGSAKFDASYEADQAFDAGREAGLQQGVEAALEDVEKAEKSGEPPHEALERRLDAWLQDRAFLEARASPRLDPGLPAGADLGYRGPTACNAAGITYRQLDYWAKSGLVVPSARSRAGTGTQRLYTKSDIVLLKVVKRLTDAGVSIQQVRAALHHLRARGLKDMGRVTLMSDGQTVYETTSNDEVIDLLQSGQGMFGISIGGVVREVEQALSELPHEATVSEDSPGPA
jgi:DNA-binding transcriptional MerR regulator